MFNLIKRNLLIYFRKPATVFFSLLGALITFVIYLFFTKSFMLQEWNSITNKAANLMNLWVMGGILVVASMTTSLSGVSQLVYDKENSVDKDLLISGISRYKIDASYLISGALIAWVMTLISLTIMIGYFIWVDHLSFPWDKLPFVVGLTGIISIIMAQVNFIIVYSIKRVDSLDKVGSITSALSGFLVGTYIPIGVLPDMAQTVMKLFPMSYLSSLLRQILMEKELNEVFSGNILVENLFRSKLGIDLYWQKVLSTSDLFILTVIILVVLCIVIGLRSWYMGKYRK